MKIDGKRPGVDTGNYIRKGAEAGAVNKSDGTEAKVPAGDTIDLSQKAREFSRVKKLLENVPEVRGEMVVSLKNDIQSGNYKVDAGKVAGKMIERALRDALQPRKK